MPLPPPPVALLSYRRLVREALERVPSHTPEWTNLNDSDPGVTLVQLFAFLAEAVSFRADLVPERNRRTFLRLLGVPLRPARAARGLVAFSSPRGALAATTVPREAEVAAGRVPFRTERGLTVLPVEGRLYLKAPLDEARRQEVEGLYRRLYGDLAAAGATLDYYETRPFDPPATGVTLPAVDLGGGTVDGALWLALLARPTDAPAAARQAIAGKVLTLAVLPALDEAVREVPPEGSAAAGEGSGLRFHLPRLAGSDVVYDRLEARPTADLALYPGTVELTLPGAAALAWQEDLDPLEPGVGELPPSLAESEDGKRLITWIRIRPEEGAARLSGVWVNGARVVQRAWVRAEALPAGNGEPHQRAVLTETPVLPETLTLSVDGEVWQRVDDLFQAAAEIPSGSQRLAGSAADGRAEAPPTAPAAVTAPATAYTLDPQSGELRFGDGFHGARPRRGAVMVASYAHGGGRQGVVGIGAIAKGVGLPAGIQVTNPGPTWGGDDAETVEEAEHRTPRWLRHRDRLVSAEDFRELTWSTPGVDLGRVEVLPLHHPGLGSFPAEGSVTLLLVPRHDAADPDHPQPDRLFLDAVCRHLEPRRLLTTELHLVGPTYRELWVSAGVEVVPGREQGPVLERVEIEIRRFLSPLAGGFDGRGWPLEKTVEPGEVLAAAARVAGVARVTGLLLGGPGGAPLERLALVGLELPRVAGVSVAAGEPVALAELAGQVPAGTPAQVRRLPVPVIPEEC